jgi:hypothetical protein
MKPDRSTRSPARAISRQREARLHDPDARRRDEHAVRLAALDDFGVARDDGDAGLARGRARAAGDALQVAQREAFFEDEARRQIQRSRAGHHHVVDRSVHRQRADVAAGKEEWRDDVAVGRDHHPAVLHVAGGLVVAAVDSRRSERLQGEFVDELVHRPPARAVREVDPPVAEIELARTQPGRGQAPAS